MSQYLTNQYNNSFIKSSFGLVEGMALDDSIDLNRLSTATLVYFDPNVKATKGGQPLNVSSGMASGGVDFKAAPAMIDKEVNAIAVWNNASHVVQSAGGVTNGFEMGDQVHFLPVGAGARIVVPVGQSVIDQYMKERDPGLAGMIAFPIHIGLSFMALFPTCGWYDVGGSMNAYIERVSVDNNVYFNPEYDANGMFTGRYVRATTPGPNTPNVAGLAVIRFIQQ